MQKQGYDWDGQFYQDNSAVQFDLGIRAMNKLKLEGNESLLDIGCGNGKLTIELAKRLPNGNITAIELSKDMIKQAKINFEKEGIDNVRIVNMNMNDIDFRNQFDLVFSNSAIHYVKDLGVTYKAIYDALKKNGQIIIQTLLREMSYVTSSIKDIIQLDEFKEYFQGFQMLWNSLSINQTKRILEKINFKDIDIEPYKKNFKFHQEVELKNFLKAAPLVPLLESIPDELKNTFIDKYMNIYLDKVGDNNYIVNLPRIFISAKKK